MGRSSEEEYNIKIVDKEYDFRQSRMLKRDTYNGPNK